MTVLHINGAAHAVESEPDTPLLYVLRDELRLNGAKYGCGLGQCGACTVLVDGNAVFSCLVPIAALPGRLIRTIEGLGTPDAPNPVQRAFIDEQAAQCGYCIAGMVMRAQALLEQNPRPTEKEIRETLMGNLCRCGTHMRILAAVRRAAAAMQAAQGTTAEGTTAEGTTAQGTTAEGTAQTVPRGRGVAHAPDQEADQRNAHRAVGGIGQGSTKDAAQEAVAQAATGTTEQ